MLSFFYKRVFYALSLLFLNCFVSYIPIWWVRRLLYKCTGLKIGSGSRIYMKCTLVQPWKITIGKNTIINEGCVLDGRGTLNIGDNCSISMQTMIISASHDRKSKEFAYYKKPVVIKNCVWTGVRAIILDGSILNDRSIISAGSVFKGIAEEEGIYVGVPASLQKKRGLKDNYTLQFTDYFR